MSQVEKSTNISTIVDLLHKHVADTFKGLRVSVINIPQAKSINAQHSVYGDGGRGLHTSYRET